MSETTSPFAGIKVLEFAGLGAAPFACSLFADAGAEVVRIERPGATVHAPRIPVRGRTTVELDLKSSVHVANALELAEHADVLVEGFRPGVMERLGLGPDVALAANSRLVYARMTGWGQDGPAAHLPGHDLNYLAITGIARSIARQGEAPVPPLNLVADYGGGMTLAYGVALALFERTRSGLGQVIDAAMVDAALQLMSGLWQRRAEGSWNDEPGTNDMDSGAPFYNSYRTRDGEYLAIGSAEPQFYANLVRVLGAEADLGDRQWDRSLWPERRELIAKIVGQRTRDEWVEAFAGVDACVTALNRIDEAASDPQILARQSLVTKGGVLAPAPAPRLSRSRLELAPLTPTPNSPESAATVAERWKN
ncbi:CoA transferase [Aeromicrobium sp. YIM 150415]|uniref:CaiB/BaiF CoA transferase family protein n=1 Tax=Aeromicrobium sp. YIM 150415 TaxID=2803912 RepID=UPI001965E0C9|nr:CaiB/BaiF CoA-transferase family protein [Aeromicrobium sp. YIM 150415]MBM9464399.1 CoA transferase [Aeromicrobium sp. YIM 150415]